MNVWTATSPETVRQTVDWTAILPPYRVILHNDDHNTMDGVVLALTKSVPSLSIEQAIAIMMEAHANGLALVIVCPLEQAELYRERLESFGLTSTIESDR